MTFRSAIFRGEVVHKRARPKQHRFRYRVFTLLLDLDELPDLDRGLSFFGYNRWAPVAFFDRDHGATSGERLRPWVEENLRKAGLTPDGGVIRLLCYPRIFGYVFNPLSVFFCYRQDGSLAAILYEVCNTFRERHTYVIPVSEGKGSIVRQSCRKALYVSPFIDMDAAYHFRIRPPEKSVSVVIREEDNDGLLLAASYQGERESLNSLSLAACLLGFPFLTLKITAGIHWEALRLWLLGVPVFRHTAAAKAVQSSIERSIQPDA